VTDDRQRALAHLMERRLQGTPVAYLTGTREFWSLPLRVTPDVLVPRPETELVVELALQCLHRDQVSAILDLGTGSGAIALALASERPRCRITAVDCCAPALAVATSNGRALGLTGVDWRLGSWYEAVTGRRFDLIVANPPYIAAADPALGALAAEPAGALAGGPTGLEALAAIAAGAPAHLRGRGRLILEHGRDQATAVSQMLERHGFTDVRTHPDLSGHPRVTQGSFHSTHQVPT
jgi:release factor glutamine methyltransferase